MMLEVRLPGLILGMIQELSALGITLFVYKVAWWRTGLESGALGGARSAAASERPIHLLATPVTAKQTERTSPPYSQEPPGSKCSPKQRC